LDEDKSGSTSLELNLEGRTPAKVKKKAMNIDTGRPVEAFLPICSPRIVKETCDDLYESTDGDHRQNYVSPEVIRQVLSANMSAIDTLWQTLGLRRGKPVKCMDLCKLSRDSLEQITKIPNTSDRACYFLHDGSIDCSLDVSPLTLAKIIEKGDLPAVDAELNVTGASTFQRPHQFERYPSPESEKGAEEKKKVSPKQPNNTVQYNRLNCLSELPTYSAFIQCPIPPRSQ